jgi:hypothetical protein
MSSDSIALAPSSHDIVMTTLESSSATQPSAASRLYNNLPVSGHCLRLLLVHACEGPLANDAPLQCSLVVTDLRSKPSYTALSYVWGSTSSPPDNILCDGVPITVTSNCYSALRHLRAINGSFTIWIDAICINQINPEEKAQQISLMGSVYSQAKITYIWLGEGSTIMNRIMGYLGRAGFLEHFYEDAANMKRRYKRPQVFRALVSYYKGRLGLKPSTIPHHALACPYLRGEQFLQFIRSRMPNLQ